MTAQLENRKAVEIGNEISGHAGEMVVEKLRFAPPGLLGDAFVEIEHAGVAGEERALEESFAYEESAEDELFLRFDELKAAIRAELALVVRFARIVLRFEGTFLVELEDGPDAVLGEILHEVLVTGSTDGVFHDDLASVKHPADLIPVAEVPQRFPAHGAEAERPPFVEGVEIAGNEGAGGR
jgi:hypothetical protein